MDEDSIEQALEKTARHLKYLYCTYGVNVERRDYLEVCLAVADTVGVEGTAYVSEIEDKLSAGCKRRVSITQIEPEEGGPLTVVPQRERTDDGGWISKPTLFSVGGMTVEVAAELRRRGIGFETVADVAEEANIGPGTTRGADVLAKHLRPIFSRSRSVACPDQGHHTQGEDGEDTGEAGGAEEPPNGCSEDGGQTGENRRSERSDRKSEVDQSLAKKGSGPDLKAVGTRAQRQFLDVRSRMRAERLLFLHLLNCSKAGAYSAGEEDSWTVVPAKLIRDEFAGPRATYLVWEGSELVECKGAGHYVAPFEKERSRAREMRVPEDVLQRWTELGSGSRRWRLDTPDVVRTDEPAPMKTDLSDDSNHAYPELVDGALRVLKDADQVVDMDAVEEAGKALQKRESRKARRRLSSLRMARETLVRQSEGEPEGMTRIRNAYEVQELSGRLSFKNGGPQGLMGEVKAKAYAHYTNYDIRSCHTTALKEVADKLESVGVEIDTSALDEYAGKYAVAEDLSLPVTLVKIVEHAVEYGAFIPASLEQADVIEDETGHRPEIADEAEKRADCPNEALRKLKSVFSPIRELVKEISEALLNEWWDEHKQPGGPKGWKMENACGVSFYRSEWEEGHVRESKVMAWMLQGLEAAFVHSITILSEEYDYEVVANEHDGAIVDGKIQDEAIERAREMSGFHRAELVEKPFADEDEVREVYAPNRSSSSHHERATETNAIARTSDERTTSTGYEQGRAPAGGGERSDRGGSGRAPRPARDD